MVRRLAVVAIAAILGFGACAVFSQGPPDNVCDMDEDCFRAQGEVCNLETRSCEPGPPIDAGVDGP